MGLGDAAAPGERDLIVMMKLAEWMKVIGGGTVTDRGAWVRVRVKAEGEFEAGDEADYGVVLLQPVEANCKGAHQERVEGEESKIGFKSVAMVGYVQEMSTVPPEWKQWVVN